MLNIHTILNYPKRLNKNWRSLRNELNKKRSLIFKMIGSEWGLASNSFHFIDLFSFLINDKKIKIKKNQLEKKLYYSKRNFFFEFKGILEFTSSKNYKLLCIDDNFYDSPRIIIETNDCIYIIHENKVVA